MNGKWTQCNRMLPYNIKFKVSWQWCDIKFQVIYLDFVQHPCSLHWNHNISEMGSIYIFSWRGQEAIPNLLNPQTEPFSHPSGQPSAVETASYPLHLKREIKPHFWNIDLAYFPYCEKKKSRLVRSCCHLVCGGVLEVPLSLLGNGWVKIPLPLLSNGSVETLPW
jgi:hypothetical protein